MTTTAALKARTAVILAPLVILALLLVGCTGNPAKTANTHPAHTKKPSATRVIPAPAADDTTKKVPADLVGKTMGDAKTELADAGFTRVVVAGGQGVTEATKVTEVTHEGESVAPETKIVLTGAAPQAPSAGTSGSSHTSPNYTCDLDAPVETDPNHPNIIINRACGYTGANGEEHSHDPWIEGQLHPETIPDPPLSDSDPGFRDANGETKAEYCARIGYSLADCPAG